MAESAIPSEFFTAASIYTLTGATGVVYVVCGGLQRALNFNPRWLGLAISLVLTISGTYCTQPLTWANYMLAVINGFLVFCTAAGVTSAFDAADGGKAKDALKSRSAEGQPAGTRRRFNSSWW